MSNKVILLDLDNTLYPYSQTHAFAFEAAMKEICEKFSISLDKAREAFKRAKKTVNDDLSEMGASHNRLLYFQRLLENENLRPITEALNIYNTYWDTFLSKLEPFENAVEVVKDLAKEYKVALVSDLTAHIQYRKLEVLGIGSIFSAIVTSEETAHEKPHPYPFLLALNKLSACPQDAVMLGDSYEKDILGATRLGIKAFWKTDSGEESENIKVFSSFNKLRELL